MFGWRARLGLIVPSTNSVNEPDFYRNLPEGVEIHTARMKLDEESYREEDGEESLAKMTENHLDRAAELVSDPEIDIIIYGCTSGSFLKGLEYDEQIKSRLQDATGVPAITTSSALRHAASELNCESITITTPYIKEINDRAEWYFEEAGFDVKDVSGLGIATVGSGRDVRSHGSVFPTTAYREASDIDHPDADGLIITCTNYRTLEAIPHLEKDLGKPVITSNQATLWQALRTAGVDYSELNLGELFEY